MPRRNIAAEFEAMGIEPDDAEYNELEAIDRRRQAEACERDYHKDTKDFIEWRRKNRPAKYKWGSGAKNPVSACLKLENTQDSST